MKNVVAAIISRKQKGSKQYLFVTTKTDYGKFSGFLQPPSGHIENDENERSALEREVKEELGIKVKVISKISESKGDIPNYTVHWWECILLTSDIKIDKKEVSAVHWFTRKQLLKSKKVWPSTRKFFKEHITD